MTSENSLAHRRTTIAPQPLQLDRVELSYRIGAGEGSMTILDIVNDVIDFKVRRCEAKPVAHYKKNTGFRQLRNVEINLSRSALNTLIVATGISGSSTRGGLRPWVKFSFNPYKLSTSSEAKIAFHNTMNDLLPGGGYSELLADGYVNYAEFATDIYRADIAGLDAYCNRMDSGEQVMRDSRVSTIYLKKLGAHAISDITLYDKKRRDREKAAYIRRFPIVRVEAKRRLNHNADTRKMQVSGLAQIRNPFLGLHIYDRSRLSEIFSSQSHSSFLNSVQSGGLQAALSCTVGTRKDLRLRMLDQHCGVTWWSPEVVWAGVENAVEIFHSINR